MEVPGNSESSPESARRPGPWIGMAVCVAVFLAGAGAFLPRQVLWLDEATQMSGLRLGPFGVVRWLTGADPRDFGQFRDRMPPLGYWLGWAWSRAFGLSEDALRWLGVSATAAAVAFVYAAGRRAFGAAAGWVAGLAFALAPPVLVMAVEIRAYPIFLLASAAAAYFLAGLLGGSGTGRDVIGLSAALASAILAHYFGLVLAAAVLVALAADALIRGRTLRPTRTIAAVVAAAGFGIVPFARESAGMTHAREAGVGALARLESVGRLLPGLTAHPSLAVFPAAGHCARGAILVLAVLAVVRAGGDRRARFGLAVALGAGLVIVAAARLTMRGFDAARPIYNAWMWPILCLVLASGLGSSRPVPRRVAGVAAGVLLVSLGIGSFQLVRHGDHFAHGPCGTFSAIIRDLGTAEVAVIHDDPGNRPVFVACPLLCEFGPDLRQYRLREGDEPGTTRLHACLGARLGAPANRPTSELPEGHLLVIRSRPTPPGELVRQIREGGRPEGDGPSARELCASTSWRLVRRGVVVALDSADFALFERVPPLRTARNPDAGHSE